MGRSQAHGGGGGGRGRGGARRGARPRDEAPSEFEERVVKINRCSKVMKGGRRFSFSALVVYGNKRGQVGIGFGKAREVPLAVEKAISQARKELHVYAFFEHRTIHHRVHGRFGAADVTLLPAPPGTGIIAGAAVRAVAELAGVRDLRTKSTGSNNPVNLVKAAVRALDALRSREQVERLRGVSLAAAAKAGAGPREQAE